MVTDPVLLQGLRATRTALVEWRHARGRVLGPWLLGSLAIAIGLIVATGIVARMVTPAAGNVDTSELTQPGPKGDVLFLLGRNGLVLSLHALACVAGFIARSALPQSAELRGGRWVAVHDRIGAAALGFVFAATVVSLATQALALGQLGADTAAALGTAPENVLIRVSLHAVPELTALFLPLAAWIITSHRGRWDQLMAATFVTVAIAVPVLVATAIIEVYVSPHLVAGLANFARD